MAAKDKFHSIVKIALEKERWKITDDPLRIAQELVERGVKKEDIILGFQAPEIRQYNDYGVA
jgi:hypothetical protein